MWGSATDGYVIVFYVETVVLVVFGLHVLGEMAQGYNGLTFVGKTIFDTQRYIFGYYTCAFSRSYFFQGRQHVVGLYLICGFEGLIVVVYFFPVGIRWSYSPLNRPLFFAIERCDRERDRDLCTIVRDKKWRFGSE